MKFANQNFPSVRISVSSETTKFLFTLQARVFAYIVLQNVIICTQFSCIWIAFWPKRPNGWAYNAPPFSLAVGNTQLLFAGSLLKRKLEPSYICIYIIYICTYNIYIIYMYIYYICTYNTYIYIDIHIRYTHIHTYIYIYNRHIQNHVKHLRWSFLRK